MPKISVIIPTRNRPAFLREAVQSVLTQSFTDFELLIVNDGEVGIPKLGDDRCRVLENEMRGAVSARNLGVAKAKGDHIAFLDDDDVWSDHNHLAQAVENLNANCDFYFADGILKFPNGERKIFARDADAISLQYNNTILISAVCYKKSLHRVLGDFDEALPFYWDWDWYLRVARCGAALMRWPQPAVDIRIHPQNMSGDQNIAARRSNLNLLEKKHNLAPIALKAHVDFV